MIEQYLKKLGGKTYFSVYHRIGNVSVEVHDIVAKNKEEAAKKAAEYFKKASEL